MQLKISRIPCLLLCLAMICLGATASADSTQTFYYDLYTNNTVVITGYSVLSADNEEAVEIPETLKGYPVTGFSQGAFRNRSFLVSITIPDCIKQFPSYAFADCVRLRSVTLPNGLTSIPSCCFADCKKLEEISLPESVTNIDMGAFAGCVSLKSITIPEGVVFIDKSAFNDCPELVARVIAGSYAEQFCKKTGLSFNAVGTGTEVASVTDNKASDKSANQSGAAPETAATSASAADPGFSVRGCEGIQRRSAYGENTGRRFSYNCADHRFGCVRSGGCFCRYQNKEIRKKE